MILTTFILAFSLPVTSQFPLMQAGSIYFNSKAISSDGAIACVSCHLADRAYQDGYERALARKRVLSRNTPTLLNVNRYTSFFWDGREVKLLDQVKGPLFARHELNSSEKVLAEVTEMTPELKLGWTQSGLPLQRFVQQALVDFMLANATTSTRFDEWQAGRVSFSRPEQEGWRLFSGKYQCTSCHALPNFTDNKFHDVGIPRRRLILQTTANPDQKDRYELGLDYGRANISDKTVDFHAFRTPSLYNVFLTAPYMHNGMYQSIDEVLDFYSRKRIKAGQGAMTEKEKGALVAFLKTLSDSRYENSIHLGDSDKK